MADIAGDQSVGEIELTSNHQAIDNMTSDTNDLDPCSEDIGYLAPSADPNTEELEYLSTNQGLNLNYSSAVTATIQEILPSQDPFDAPAFSAVDYINSRFPAEQSLQLLDDALEEMRLKLAQVDDQTQRLVRHLATDAQTGQESLLCAEEAIKQLSARFQDIKVASGESEQRVRAITRDIRQLDTGKRNLTASITALNHLQMLTEGVEKLQRLQSARQYGEVAPLLQGVLRVLQHLQGYKHIPQVKMLADQVLEGRQQLERQVLQEFSNTAALAVPSKRLAEACLVADVLDAEVRSSIINEVVQHQLAEYRAVFAGSERDGGLNCVNLRKKWFLRAAVEFDRTLAQMFPPGWKVPARLAYSFCLVTHDQLTQAMTLRTTDLDSATMLQAHRILSDLESLIVQKYGNVFTREDLTDVGGKSDVCTDTAKLRSSSFCGSTPTTPTHQGKLLASVDEKTENQSSPHNSPFVGGITNCFLPYLHIYIDTVDKRIGEQLEQFVSSVRNYRFDRLEEEESNVMPCCGELFTLYKNILVEYLRLSNNGHSLPTLTLVLQRRLREFATRVLRQALPPSAGGGGGMPGQGGLAGNIPKDMRDIGAIITQVQSLLVRDGEGVRLNSDEELMRVCSVLVSAEYCAQMTEKLEAKLKQKWQHQTAPASSGDDTHCDANKIVSVAPCSISLTAEEELFHAVLSQCILLLVGHCETACEASLSAAPKLCWLLEQTGDQSDYVGDLTANLASTVPLIRYHLHTSRRYFTRFCDKLAASICGKFTQQVYRCRPINSVGCEQLLLDCHALKAALLRMPVMGSKVLRDPPVSYTRMVTKSLSRPELVLQVVMGEYSSHQQLLDKSIRLMPELSLADFQKVLEMRGVKEKSSLLEAYRQRTASAAGSTEEVAAHQVVAASPEHELSKIAKLEKMLKARRLI